MDQRSRTNGLSGRGSAQCIEDRRQKTADVLVSKFGCVETPMPRSAGSRQVCLWERRRCIFCFCGSVEKRRDLAIETTIATQATLPQRPCDAFRRSHNGRLLSLNIGRAMAVGAALATRLGRRSSPVAAQCLYLFFQQQSAGRSRRYRRANHQGDSRPESTRQAGAAQGRVAAAE